MSLFSSPMRALFSSRNRLVLNKPVSCHCLSLLCLCLVIDGRDFVSQMSGFHVIVYPSNCCVLGMD